MKDHGNDNVDDKDGEDDENGEQERGEIYS